MNYKDYIHDTKYWLTFCGSNQSGSTIVSAILDSHPNVRVTTEQQSIYRWYVGKLSKELLMERVLTYGQSRLTKSMGLPGGNWTARENQKSLLIIGEKQVDDIDRAVSMRRAGLDLLDEFSGFVGLPIKLINTIRNPYDSIAARLEKKAHIERYHNVEEAFDANVRRYVSLYKVIDPFLNRHPHFKLYNEELIKDPKETLIRLCEYLELPVVEPWLATAMAAVFTEPHNRKDNREWLPGQKKDIELRIIDEYPYFYRYKE